MPAEIKTLRDRGLKIHAEKTGRGQAARRAQKASVCFNDACFIVTRAQSEWKPQVGSGISGISLRNVLGERSQIIIIKSSESNENRVKSSAVRL